MIWKFVKGSETTKEEVMNTKIGRIYKKLSEGKKLSREEKDYLFKQMVMNSFGNGRQVALYGWMFDFGDWVKKYWVKFEYGGMGEFYACDKTSIRNHFGDYLISEIIEVK